MSYLDAYLRHPGRQVSRYQELHTKKDMPEDSYRYEGVFGGEAVSFSRMFRDRLLTDAECEALCDGLTVTLQGLSRVSGGRTVQYGVRVALECKTVQGVQNSFRSTVIRVKDTLLCDPDYRFSRALCEQENRNQALPEGLFGSTGELLGQPLDGFSDEDDAMLAAMVAAPELPLVQRVQTGLGQIPVFVPVLYADDAVTQVSDGQDAMRVEHATDDVLDSEPALLNEKEMAMENQMAMYESLDDITITEDLEVDEDDWYPDDEGIDPDGASEFFDGLPDVIDENSVFA